MKKQKQKKVFKRWIDAVIKIITCLLFFIVLGIEAKTSFLLTIIIKLGGSILLFYFMLLLDKYGRI